MKTSGIFFVLVTLFLITLIYLMSTVPTLDSQYEAIVEEIMERDGLISEDAVLNNYPKLKELKNDIHSIKKIQFNIRHKTGHPIPPNKVESEKILKQIETLALLKERTKVHLMVLKNGGGGMVIGI